MKILITGSTGYIANNLKIWLLNKRSWFVVETVSLRESIPKHLSGYDAIVHAAGLVHKKEKKQNPNDYYEINTVLTEKIAKQAKEQGVKHFVFLSTMAVYGQDGEICRKIVIDEKTETKPQGHYGKSKLAAEKILNTLLDKNFKVAIIRPPMVYGDNCPGNFKTLKFFAENTFIFPDVDNKRSMLHIDNLCQLIFLILENESSGIFHPQNREFVRTSYLVEKLAKSKGHKVILSKILGKIIMKTNNQYINKIFGNLVYNKRLSNHFEGKYMLRE